MSESDMNDDRPFTCPQCNQRFTNDDRLSAHIDTHRTSPAVYGKLLHGLVDSTPTPTKFFKSLDEIELFNDALTSPFEEAFKTANQESPCRIAAKTLDPAPLGNSSCCLQAPTVEEGTCPDKSTLMKPEADKKQSTNSLSASDSDSLVKVYPKREQLISVGNPIKVESGLTVSPVLSKSSRMRPIRPNLPKTSEPSNNLQNEIPDYLKTPTTAILKLNNGQQLPVEFQVKQPAGLNRSAKERLKLRLQSSSQETSFGEVTNISISSKNGSDDVVEDKNKDFRERNKYAAARSREKKRRQLINMKSNFDEVRSVNKSLQVENSSLRAEVAHLKTLLIAHQECPIFEQQRSQGLLQINSPLQYSTSSAILSSSVPLQLSSSMGPLLIIPSASKLSSRKSTIILNSNSLGNVHQQKSIK